MARIQFYQIPNSPVIEWDIVDDGYSVITGKRLAVPEGCSDDPASGFYLNDEKIAQGKYLPVPSSPERALTWLLFPVRFFSWFWTLRILLGNERTLLSACRASRKNFYPTLQEFLHANKARALERQKEQLREADPDAFRATVQEMNAAMKDEGLETAAGIVTDKFTKLSSNDVKKITNILEIGDE